jgi:nucleotide-binding universal stress UspA family protein
VLEDVTTLAKLMQSTIHVVRVTLPLLPTGDPYFEPIAIDTEGPQRYVDQICDRLLKQGILAVPEIREGFAAQEIVKAARDHRAGLIAMATLGRGGRARPMERSVAGDVLPLAPCPVLLRRAILPPSTGSKGEGKRIPMIQQEA